MAARTASGTGKMTKLRHCQSMYNSDSNFSSENGITTLAMRRLVAAKLVAEPALGARPIVLAGSWWFS